jgi:hypothetical protein
LLLSIQQTKLKPLKWIVVVVITALGNRLGGLVVHEQESLLEERLGDGHLVVQLLPGVLQIGHHHSLGIGSQKHLNGRSIVQFELQRLQRTGKLFP